MPNNEIEYTFKRRGGEASELVELSIPVPGLGEGFVTNEWKLFEGILRWKCMPRHGVFRVIIDCSPRQMNRPEYLAALARLFDGTSGYLHTMAFYQNVPPGTRRGVVDLGSPLPFQLLAARIRGYGSQ